MEQGDLYCGNKIWGLGSDLFARGHASAPQRVAALFLALALDRAARATRGLLSE